MSTPEFPTAADLPPKPDPETGQPRPPRAPGFHQRRKTREEQHRTRDLDPATAPPVPDGQGPTLAWFKASRRHALSVAAGGLIIFPIGTTLYQGLDLRWMSVWWIWLMILFFCWVLYGIIRKPGYAVGAQWFADDTNRTWVRLYELTEIKVKHRGTNMHLYLTDRAGRKIIVTPNDIQQDRDMWDYIYNGILHSVIAGGATTNGTLHRALRVPRPHPQSTKP